MNNLRTIRKQRGLALWGLAAKTKISTSLLSAIERWGYEPTIPLKERIANILEVPMADIWPSAQHDTKPGQDSS